MDPDECLEQLRAATAQLKKELDESKYADPRAAGYAVVESFEALDGWLSSGGFVPREWRQHG